MKFFARWLIIGLLCAGVWAQSGPQWNANLSTQQCRVGDQVVLELKLEGANSDPEQPSLPDLAGLSLQFAGASKNYSSINGLTSSSSTFTYIITATQAGRQTIPPISIVLEGVTYQTQPLSLTVADASSNPFPSSPPAGIPGSGGPPNSPSLWSIPNQMQMQRQVQAQPVLVECEVNTRRPYVNQLVVYTFRFLHRTNLAEQPHYEPASATGFLREDLGQATTQVERQGVHYSASEVKTAFFPTAAGHLSIGPTRISCRLTPDLFDTSYDAFLDPVKELTTQSIELEVQPLPEEGRPPSFSGAVGSDFSLKASLNKQQLKAGEPVKLSLTLSGNCHPDLILDPKLPNWPQWRSYPSESQVDPFEKPNYRVSKTFSIPLVPLQPGRQSLNPLTWSYFDPEQARYLTLEAEPLSLEVTGPPLEASPTPSGDQPSPQPLSPPRLGSDTDPSWAQRPLWGWLALLPWALSLALLGLDQARQRWHAGQSSRSAQLARLRRQIAKAQTLAELCQLTYQSLSLTLATPLQGLPFQRLRQLLSGELVDQLEQAESERYGPRLQESPERLETFRRLLLSELKP